MLKKLFVLLFVISASLMDMTMSKPPDNLEDDAVISLLAKCEDKEIQQLYRDLQCDEGLNFIDYILDNPPALFFVGSVGVLLVSLFQEHPDWLKDLHSIIGVV